MVNKKYYYQLQTVNRMKNQRNAQLPLKYYYTSSNEFYVKAINFLGLITSLVMLYGLIMLCLKNLEFFIIFTPFILIFLFYLITHFLFNLKYRKFNIESHRKWADRFWRENKNEPPVDIFIPYCGEGLEIIRETGQAAKNINYNNKNIYILDDSGDEEVRKLASEMGIGYFSRPDRGYMKKAGNLNYAIDRTEGDFMAVFDTDFMPEADFLKDLLPYFSDEKVGIIQSPQYYIDESSNFFGKILLQGCSSLQEDFYKIIQPSRNIYHSAICVGTNLIYRRSSLKISGGVANVPYCEDFETGFDVTAAGFKIQYIPLILAKGRCPENPQAYFNQHRRWCYSCVRLLFSRKFFKAPVGFIVRVAYISNIFYYFTEGFSILVIFLFTVLMTARHHVIDTRYFDYFLPYFLYLFLVQPLFRLKKINIGSFITATLQSFAYLYTLIVMIISRDLDWIPSHKKINRATTHFINFIILSAVIIAIEIYNLCTALALKNITFRLWSSYPFIGWFFFLFATQILLMSYLTGYLISIKIKKPLAKS